MSPAPKRRHCRKCGGPMAGHKRPNRELVCPTPDKALSPEPETTVMHSPLYREDAIVPPVAVGGVYRYRNPNWEEPETDVLLSDDCLHGRDDTPYSWVSTELADDGPYYKPETDFIDLVRDRQEIQSLQGPPSLVSSSASGSSRLRRSLSNVLTNTVPLLSLFGTQKEDIQSITQAARRNGLHTGVIRRPGLDIVKEELEESSTVSKQKKRWWVVLGTDPEAVEHLMDLQERDTIARLEAAHSGIALQSPAFQVQSHKPFQFSLLGIVGLVTFVTFTGVFAAIVSLSFV